MFTPNKHSQLKIRPPRTKLKSLRASLLLFLIVGFMLMTAHHVYADELQPMIDAVTKQIQDNQAVVNAKQTEGDTLQNRLTIVQADLNTSRANLELTRLKLIQTKQDQAQAELDLQKQIGLLKESIAAIYKNGNVTTLEIIASTDNLSEYVGKERYYSSLRTKIDANVQAVKGIKNQLADFGTQLRIRTEEEQLEIAAIGKKEAELATLLATTRGEENEYRKLVENDKAKLSVLRTQQAAAIAARSAGRDYSLSTDYTWKDAEPFPNSGVDPWGFYYRQCTSYVAWKRASVGKPIPAWGFLGPANAKDWPQWGRTFNMTVDDQPEAGAMAVYPVGEYGHVMYVEAVVANGTQVLVSEFNASWEGKYSQSVWPSSALTFIH